MEEEQGQDLMGRHEAAGPVEHSEAVRVAVLGDREIEVLPAHPLGGGRQVRRDRLGVNSSEEGVSLRMQGDNARRSAREDLLQQRPGRAVHRVGQDGEARRADPVERDERGEVVAVGGPEVQGLDRGRVRGFPGHCPVQSAGHGLVELGRRARALVSLDLHAVVLGRVVARRDREAAGQAHAARVM